MLYMWNDAYKSYNFLKKNIYKIIITKTQYFELIVLTPKLHESYAQHRNSYW